MTQHKRTWLGWGLVAIALLLLSSCGDRGMTGLAAGGPPWRSTAPSSRLVMSGTRINVALGSNISSETANIGDSWRGTVTENVIIQNRGRIPPGSAVDGVVTGVTAGDLGSRAMLELGVRSIRVDGHDEWIAAGAEPVIAGSERARYLYAITDGVPAKALIGENIGEAEVAAATGVVARPSGGQIILTDGTVMSFTVTVTVAIR